MIKLTVTTILLLYCVYTNGQSLLANKDSVRLQGRYLNEIESKVSFIDGNLEKKTLKTIRILQKEEEKLAKLIQKKDSVASSRIFALSETSYKQLINRIQNPPAQSLNEYIPQFDSLKTSLKFLNDPIAISQQKIPNDVQRQLTSVTGKVASLESKLQEAENIKHIIRERQRQLLEQLNQFGLTKKLGRINKEVFYYQQQLAEYKLILKDRKMAEQKCMAILRDLPAFKQFMSQHSMLALLFRLPDNYVAPPSFNGLQTRAAIQSQIEQRFAGTSINPQQYIGQQVQQAQEQLNKLKDKVSHYGSNSSDFDMPYFKPNTQKTKRFINRMEYGLNIQSQKVNGLLPVTSDIALTAGYKLNDKSVVGAGLSYKLGWGTSWQHIQFSNQGIGLRSFIDWKLAPIFGKIDGFWISGGYEQNYQHAFNSIPELRLFNVWHSSGLLGLTRKLKIGKKTNNVQVLWDFLSYGQVPRRSAFIYRIGIKL